MKNFLLLIAFLFGCSVLWAGETSVSHQKAKLKKSTSGESFPAQDGSSIPSQNAKAKSKKVKKSGQKSIPDHDWMPKTKVPKQSGKSFPGVDWKPKDTTSEKSLPGLEWEPKQNATGETYPEPQMKPKEENASSSVPSHVSDPSLGVVNPT